MSTHITVTTGIYDAIKEVIRTRKVSIPEINRLTAELKEAQQVLRRDLPEDTVTVNRVVKIKDHTENEEKEYIFVPSPRANPKKNKYSILSDIALATVGYKVGDVIEWPFKDGDKKIEILEVSVFEA